MQNTMCKKIHLGTCMLSFFLCNISSKLSDFHTNVLCATKCNRAVPKIRTAYGEKSFAFRGETAWNKLDLEMKLASRVL